ncbi:DUF1289 domain-containing protein [Vibrio pectenicida]|uniref:DUF1289 domain-containing protein n=1 Tax=Vibrio pectenicida TaxID=62763 RepID=A0A7Y4EEQ4_9VIBR|nr:DUF1289 domain-containing protein [Vibrio pectenicida]
MNKEVPSPCVRLCCLNEEDICLGCYRTLTEILDWNTFSSEEKIKVTARCAKRKKSFNGGRS